jgi:hypothetical protein
MTAFVSAIYAEGRTDERFLPTIIQRTAADLLARRGRNLVDVLDPVVLNADPEDSRADKILSVARRASGYHVLFVHADADRPTADQAYRERINPGVQRVRAALDAGEDVCQTLTPVVPIQMLEAWLLADPDALRTVIGTNMQPTELDIPSTPGQIEGLADPKQQITEIIRRAYAHRARRRRRFNLGEFYQPLASQIRLERLAQLPAYQRFVDDLATALVDLDFIPR